VRVATWLTRRDPGLRAVRQAADAWRVERACDDLAAAIREPTPSTPERGDVTLSGAPNAWLVDVEVWLGGVADDLARVVLAPR
jgi:hypothetical protein